MVDFRESSEESGYVTVGGWVIYVEVSSATEDAPYVSIWKKGDNE